MWPQRASHQLKVFDSVVRLVFVQMVDVLTPVQDAAQAGFHH